MTLPLTPGVTFPILLAAAIAAVMPASAQPTFLDPSEVASFTLLGGARERNFGTGPGEEVFVGVGDLGAAGSRNSQALVWRRQSATNDFSLNARNAIRVVYDTAADTITQFTTLAGAPPVSVTYDNVSQQVPVFVPPFRRDDVDGMQILLRSTPGPTRPSILIQNLTLNGTPLGSLAPGDETFTRFFVVGVDFTQSWELQADLYLFGDFGTSQEAFRVEFNVVDLVPIPEPAAPALLAAGAAVLGLRRRKSR